MFPFRVRLAKFAICSTWLEDVALAGVVFCFTAVPWLVGLCFGMTIGAKGGVEFGFLQACVHADAVHYVSIIEHGYSYHADGRSSVAFFPAFPVLAWIASHAFGLTAVESSILVSNLMFLWSLVFLLRWIRLRWPSADTNQRGVVALLVGFWPLSLFFRLPYSESTFSCGLLLFFYGMAARWSPVYLAVLAGFLTAVRPVGLAVTAGLIWFDLQKGVPALKTIIPRTLMLLTIGIWGLLAYMLFLYWSFGDALAFARTQQHWTFNAPSDMSLGTKVAALMALEPIVNVYDPNSVRYWGNVPMEGGALLSIMFWNPLFFAFAALVLFIGWYKKWLIGPEVVIGLLLLFIPYVTRAYEMSMASHGRFAMLVVPCFVVLGRAFSSAESYMAVIWCGISATVLCIFTALFAGGYQMF